MTLAEFKRLAASGKISLELVERFGKIGEEIPENLRGKRKISKVNTVAVFLKNENGKESELAFKSAKLFECDGKFVTIYAAAQREPTAEEKAVLDTWQRVQAEYIAQNPYAETFWKMKDYFKNCSCPWMSGFDETIKGKRYQTWNGKVLDGSIKGEPILKYIMYTEEA